MIDGVIIKKIEKNIDSRGWLAEIYRQDETDYKFAMSYISVTKPVSYTHLTLPTKRIV